MLQELVEGASQKAYEYVFWRKDADGYLRFKTADALKIIPIYDEFYNIDQIIYYYDDQIVKNNKQKTVTKIQLWTKEEVFYFIQEDSQAVKLDASVEFNPKSHILAQRERASLAKVMVECRIFAYTIIAVRQTTCDQLKISLTTTT